MITLLRNFEVSKKQILLFFLVALLSTVLYVPFRENKRIELLVVSQQSTLIETFWRDSVTFYPQDTKVFTVDSGKPHVLVADISFNRPIAQIRIDPVQKVGQSAEIQCVRLYSNDKLVKEFSASAVQSTFTHDLQLEFTNDRCRCTSVGDDPHLALDIPLSDSIASMTSISEKILLFFVLYCKIVLLFVFVCILGLLLVHKPQWFMVVTFVSILVVMLLMVTISPLDGHPDEYFHKITAEYYFAHWIPTHPDDPSIFYTYNDFYNVSRINSPGFAYLFSGKFGFLVHQLFADVTICIRLFSVCLIASVLLFFKNLKQYYVLFLPIVLSPQIWYLFSYVNDEALPLFLSFIIVYLLINSKTWFHRFLDSQTLFKGIVYSLLLIVPVFLLMISKFNFWVFVLFIPVLVFYLEVSKLAQPSVKKAVFLFLKFSNLRFKKYCLIAISALLLTGMYYGVYFYIRSNANRPVLTESQELVIKNREAVSKLLFKPSYKIQGIKYAEMMKEWVPSTFQSSAGKYNYMLVSGSTSYYIVMAVLYVFLLLLLLFEILRNSSILDKIMFVLSILFILGMIFVSSYVYSWQYDYQPQGRYLFPILPIFGVLFYIALKNRINKSIALLTVVLFALSVYSFLMVGVQAYL